MKRLAKNFILATATVSAIFFVDPALYQLNEPPHCQMDFWSKFRDTVMPDEPQDNNPPKEMRKPRPTEKPKPPKKHRPRN